MPRPRKLLPMQECVVRDEHKRGVSIVDIAYRYGVSASTVQRIVRNEEGKKKPMIQLREHQNFDTLIKRDGTNLLDSERASLFWILSGNEDLFGKAAYIYDFKEHSIIPEVLESAEVDFCTSSRALVKLGFNLFNGFPADVMGTFKSLDEANYALALEAINVRFNL